MEKENITKDMNGNTKKEIKSDVYNVDCVTFMRTLPDNYFNLCIADPPYGIGISNNPFRQKHDKKLWDNQIPTNEVLLEMQRVSKHCIIWGGNYFNLPPNKHFIIWDKEQPFDFSSAMCEYAWSNINSPAKMFRYRVTTEKNKIHPTQKPVALYAWLLDNYGNGGVKYSTLFWGVEAVELQHTRKASISMLANLTKIISKHKKNASEQSVWGRINKRMVV